MKNRKTLRKQLKKQKKELKRALKSKAELQERVAEYEAEALPHPITSDANLKKLLVSPTVEDRLKVKAASLTLTESIDEWGPEEVSLLKVLARVCKDPYEGIALGLTLPPMVLGRGVDKPDKLALMLKAEQFTGEPN